MDLGDWPVVSGRLTPSFQGFNFWNESHDDSNLLDDYVTTEHQFSSDANEPFCFENAKVSPESHAVPFGSPHVLVLSTSPEDSYFSDYQMRQFLQPLPTYAGQVFSVGCQYVCAQNYTASSFPVIPSHGTGAVDSVNGPALLHGHAGDTDVEFSSRDVDILDVLAEMCDTFDGDMIVDQVEQLSSFDSFLPPMSLEDVDCLLSSDSLSSSDAAGAGCAVSSPSSCWSTGSSPRSPDDYDSSSSSADSPPAIVPQVVVVKRQRKKEQNKTAALRYRQKKRSENGTVSSEYEALEKRNGELKEKVTEMTREVNYLKELIAEICA